MNAVIVSVDYAHILRHTLPYNRHHFDRIMVVTSFSDHESREVALQNNCEVHRTEAFYARGACFNKFLAIEEGLDLLGRQGWLCLLDADVLWPQRLRWRTDHDNLCLRIEECGKEWVWSPGHLLCPLRRMCPLTTPPLPLESEWSKFPIHPNVREWAGYSQIFHASDPVLGPPPWHEINWRHAGGADSFFQAKWSAENKIRPPFDALHLGPAKKNWAGVGNEKELREMLHRRGRGLGDPYVNEKFG